MFLNTTHIRKNIGVLLLIETFPYQIRDIKNQIHDVSIKIEKSYSDFFKSNLEFINKTIE